MARKLCPCPTGVILESFRRGVPNVHGPFHSTVSLLRTGLPAELKRSQEYPPGFAKAIARIHREQFLEDTELAKTLVSDAP